MYDPNAVIVFVFFFFVNLLLAHIDNADFLYALPAQRARIPPGEAVESVD